MACSKAKSTNPNLLPAIERYDGPYFRVLRRFFREVPSGKDDIKVLVLSARYGLISGECPIPNYDHIMTTARAVELRPQVLDSLINQITHDYWAEIFVLMSAKYHEVIKGFEDNLPSSTRIICVKGAQGVKARQLKDWLHGGTARLDSKDVSIATRHPQRGYALIHGHLLSLTPEQVIGIAQHALRSRYGQPNNYRDWYVMVGERRVGPKWLVSQVAGLAVGDFTSGEARRVLAELGVEVRHV
jgi:hypothetical protein